MANSFVNYTGDGIQDDFAVTFNFISRTHVTVTVDGVPVTFTWINDGLITTTAVPGAGTLVQIKRSSSPTLPLVDFEAGYLSADDLDTGYLHTFYLAQEAVDAANLSITKDATDNWDAQGDRIVNVGDPQAAQDATTKSYVDAIVSVAGNVPPPGAPSIGFYLKALTATTFGWFNIFSLANTWLDVLTVRRSGTNSVSLETTAAGAGAGPFLRLWRDITGAASNLLGSIVWEANDASGNKETAAEIDVETVDATNGTEDYQYRFRTKVAGTTATRLKLGAGLYSQNATGGDKGIDTVNASVIYDDNVQLKNSILQIVQQDFSAVATGTTVLPNDDTIPQSTEGDEYMTATITPLSTTSTLLIEVQIQLAGSGAGVFLASALFKDSETDARTAWYGNLATTGQGCSSFASYKMTSGSLSATTFKVRAGGEGSGTTTFNGEAGARRFGTLNKSYIRITEIVPQV